MKQGSAFGLLGGIGPVPFVLNRASLAAAALALGFVAAIPVSWFVARQIA